MKIGELQDQENHMAEVLIHYDSAISSGDASSLSESSLREVTPVFNDPSFLHIGPTPTTSPKVSPKVGPVRLREGIMSLLLGVILLCSSLTSHPPPALR